MLYLTLSKLICLFKNFASQGRVFKGKNEPLFLENALYKMRKKTERLQHTKGSTCFVVVGLMLQMCIGAKFNLVSTQGQSVGVSPWSDLSHTTL